MKKGKTNKSEKKLDEYNQEKHLKPFKTKKFATEKEKKLKQILSLEQSLVHSTNFPTFSNIEAPPALIPSKKYCDLTGFNTTYTDPKTLLNFCNRHCFKTIQKLSEEDIKKYLELRKKQNPIFGT